MLARSATADQATFEPDEDEDEDDDDEEDEDELDDEEDDEPLPTASPDFLSLLPDLSAEESDFLASDPFVEALAASESFWAARLSVR
jgi:hypothetical protein